MDLIPNEILEKIFGYTDFDTILNLSTICKLFRSMIGLRILLDLHDMESIIFKASGFKKSTYWYELIKLAAIKRGYVEIDDNPCFIMKCDFDVYQKNMSDVSKFNDALQHIKNQTEKICLIAVNRNVHALQYVKNQTNKICLTAVQIVGWVLCYVRKQTNIICLTAVKTYGKALRYVNNQTYEICLKAVKQDGKALRYVKNQTYEICLAAVQQNGYALKYVKNQSDDICLAAIEENGYAFRHIKNQNQKHKFHLAAAIQIRAEREIDAYP